MSDRHREQYLKQLEAEIVEKVWHYNNQLILHYYTKAKNEQIRRKR